MDEKKNPQLNESLKSSPFYLGDLYTEKDSQQFRRMVKERQEKLKKEGDNHNADHGSPGQSKKEMGR